MKFLVDESVEDGVVKYLRNAQHNTVSVSELSPGLRDVEVLSLAWREKRILITNDKDFGELIVRFGQPHAGVILFRLFQENAASKIASLRKILEKHASVLPRSFVIVSLRTVRIRHRTQ